MAQSIVQLRGAGVNLVGDRWAPDTTPVRGTVLLLHGGGQTRHSWRHTGLRLASAGWEVIAVDLRGHGDSDWASDGDYSTEAVAADIRAVISTLPSPPVLVGASLGGLAALLTLGEDPTSASALVLVDITPTTQAAGTAEITRFMQSGEGGFASLEEASRAVAAYNPQRSRPPRPEGLRKNLRLRGERWYWHWDPRLLSRRRIDPVARQEESNRAREAARAVTVPTLLVRGVDSRVVGEDGVREFLTLIPGAWHVDVASTGHMVAGDDNDLFGHYVTDFLHRVIRPA